MFERIERFLDLNPPQIDFGANEMRELNYGSTRVVFEIVSGPMAGNIIKFARRDSDKKTNRAEVATWKRAEKEGKTEYFCPIVDYDSQSYSWVVMEKAVMDVSYDQLTEFREEVQEEFPDQRMDVMSCNIGHHNDQMKLVDYSWN